MGTDRAARALPVLPPPPERAGRQARHLLHVYAPPRALGALDALGEGVMAYDRQFKALSESDLRRLSEYLSDILSAFDELPAEFDHYFSGDEDDSELVRAYRIIDEADDAVYDELKRRKQEGDA